MLSLLRPRSTSPFAPVTPLQEVVVSWLSRLKMDCQDNAGVSYQTLGSAGKSLWVQHTPILVLSYRICTRFSYYTPTLSAAYIRGIYIHTYTIVCNRWGTLSSLHRIVFALLCQECNDNKKFYPVPYIKCLIWKYTYFLIIVGWLYFCLKFLKKSFFSLLVC